MHLLEQLWRPSLIGGLIIMMASMVGWWDAAVPQRWTVRAVEWWLQRVVDPLLGLRSWLLRWIVIFANNAVISTALVAVGYFRHGPWLMLAMIGFGLGLAMNRLSLRNLETGEPPEHLRRVVLFCFGLNLLEVPAILLSAGLSLAQATIDPFMTGTEAWSYWIGLGLPMLLIAAGGEAYWMSILRSHPGDSTDSDHD